MHLLDHPHWPLIYVCAKACEGRYRKVEIRKMPLDVFALAMRITMPCVSCGMWIHPIRERKQRVPTTDRRHKAHGGACFYAGTCPGTVSPGCSRTTKAAEDIDRMLAAIRGNGN